MKSFLRSILFLAFLAVLAGAAAIYYGINLWQHPWNSVTFTVRPGETFGQINHRLAQQNLIINPRLFYHYVRHQGRLNQVRAGRFPIKAHATMGEVYQALFLGPILADKVIIPEGKNLYEIAQILEKSNITRAEDFIATAQDPDLLVQLGIPGPSAEGYLYPDTYQFAHHTPAKAVITAMKARFDQVADELDHLQHPSLSPEEVVILASIVEKETGAGEERPLIAGVFLNRLAKRMRLQSDPTTIYGIFETFNGNLRRKDLETYTPYNTYRIPRLPVGPIANPGKASLAAVLHPAQHSYLYFVSNNDGTHTFSQTFKEHDQAVTRLQKSRKARQGKSWRDYQNNKRDVPDETANDLATPEDFSALPATN